MGSEDGRKNAPVAPSPCNEDGLEGMGETPGVGGSGATGTRGRSLTTGGGGFTKMGACGDRLES